MSKGKKKKKKERTEIIKKMVRGMRGKVKSG